MAASTARNSDSYIGACHRARLRRLDPGRANKATAHQLARLVHAMLTRGEEYVAREVADFEAERHDRQLRNLQRQGGRPSRKTGHGARRVTERSSWNTSTVPGAVSALSDGETASTSKPVPSSEDHTERRKA